MQCVILAAGRGKRLNPITETCPKPLIEILGKPIIERTLSSLPSQITEAIIVVGYLGDQIKKRLGEKFGKIRIKYVTQKELSGTAGALWLTKPFLGKEKFLVLNSDDFYKKEALGKCLKNDLSVGLYRGIPPHKNFFAIDLKKDGTLKSFRRPTKEELEKGALLIIGVYVLDQRIFEYEPVKISETECGLPQTILAMSKDYPVKGVLIDWWHTITFPEDINKIEDALLKTE